MRFEQDPKYDDIIHLPRPVSKTHPQMPLSDRAAQFSPFAALTGYGDAVREAARWAEEERGNANQNASRSLDQERDTDFPILPGA